jgi:farnesol dehydrogenase
MRTILVTGATGFVGRRLVRRLLDQGLPVRLFVRDPARLDDDVRDRVEIVGGALGDAAAVRRATAGAGWVLHLAALARAHATDPDDFRRLNAAAVEQLLAAAADNGVDRFVHVSTVAALPPARFAPQWGIPRRPTPYAISKAASEELVRAYAAAGLHAVIVRPSRVYGPGPWNDANGTTQLMAMYLRGTLRCRLADGDVHANYVHVDDVAAGIELAARHGRRGAAYNLGGENASLRGYLDAITEASGVRRRTVALPPQLALAAAYLCALWGRLGGEPSLTPDWLNNFLEHRPIDIASSRRDLGYRPRSLREGVRQTLVWLTGGEGGESHVGTLRLRPREDWS